MTVKMTRVGGGYMGTMFYVWFATLIVFASDLGMILILCSLIVFIMCVE